VNYVGRAGRVWAPGEAVPGSAAVAAAHLQTALLWTSVRVIGGAYGALAGLDRTAGTLAQLSYRDPALAGTLEIFGAAGAALAEAAAAMSAAELELAVIGAMGSLDAPQPAEDKGLASLLRWRSGETPAMRQRWRDEMLATTPADLAEFGRRLALATAQGPQAVVASATALAQAVKGGAGLAVTAL
jgi:Zn-dependent M16 (insulinase) family peptidase